MITDINIYPYQKNKSNLQKFHILNSNNTNHIFKISNVYAPFGLQTNSDHKTKTDVSQHRFNIGFSIKEIESNNKTYLELFNIINTFEQFFKGYDELEGYTLLSNHINRDNHGCIFRFHLRTFKNKTTTPFIQIENNVLTDSEWIAYNIENKVDIEFSPDCLWINDSKKLYGISFIINKVYQQK